MLQDQGGSRGRHPPAVGRCGLRSSRYRRLAKTSLQHQLASPATSPARFDAHLTDTPRARTRTSHFAQLRPADQTIDGAKATPDSPTASLQSSGADVTSVAHVASPSSQPRNCTATVTSRSRPSRLIVGASSPPDYPYVQCAWAVEQPYGWLMFHRRLARLRDPARPLRSHDPPRHDRPHGRPPHRREHLRDETPGENGLLQPLWGWL